MDKIKHKQLGAILLTLGLVVVAYTLHVARRDGTLLADGRMTAGQVADRYTTGRRTDAPRPALRVVYLDETNAPTEVREEVDDAFWESHPPGTALQVRYVPGHPDRASLVGATNKRALAYAKLGGGALMLLAGIAVLLYDRIRV